MTLNNEIDELVSVQTLDLDNKEIQIFWIKSLSKSINYKKQHNLGRWLLKTALKNKYKIKFKEEMLAYNKFNKPYLLDFPNIHFNLSHSNKIVMLALANQEIGIDIEEIYNFTPSLIDYIFSEKEKEFAQFHNNSNLYFTRLWTLKESFFKYKGTGLKFPLRNTTFSLDNNTKEFVKENEIFYQDIIGKNSIFSICTQKD